MTRQELKICLLKAKDLGDFQTPLELAHFVAAHLTTGDKRWTRVLEPTCGEGNFLRALAPHNGPECEMQGIELQAPYIERARQTLRADGVNARLHQGNIFDFRLDSDLTWRAQGPLLVVGNPPWVTNSALGASDSVNLPRKENLKGLSGLDAMTGESNFDLAEAIWIKLIRELLSQSPTLALLCKTSVARNVLAYARAQNWPVVAASLHRIDSKKWFGAAVDAALFTVELGAGPTCYQCPVYPSLQSAVPEATIGFEGGRIIADVAAYRRAALADGNCPFVWRQGIKHDASSVMELRRDGKTLVNKLGEAVDIEAEFVYPLLKSSDLYKTSAPIPRWSMIVPQKRVGQETATLKARAPKLWRYLHEHREFFARRKSSIYTNQPEFAVFGVGDYSFAPHKVAVAGMTKTPRFWPLAPFEGRPVVLDDTCYLLPCQTREQAVILSATLNGPLCLDLLSALTFTDAKRPITKKLLQRVDLMKLIELEREETKVSEAKILLAPLLSSYTKLENKQQILNF